MRRHLWAIVLAAGAGRRLAGLTKGVPKQFWRPTGGASLLDTTLQRVSHVAAKARTVVVVDRSHRPYATAAQSTHETEVLYQPLDRGTGTGVLLGLTPVLSSNPEAVVVLTPSDHGVLNPMEFTRTVLRAAGRAARCDEVILFGIEPDLAVTDYGWIVPAGGPDTLRAVKSFVEKPSRPVAEQLLTRGGVWNTMVVVARASVIRGLYQSRWPDLVDVFDTAATLSVPMRGAFLSEVYPGLRSADFSRDLLEGASNLRVHTWPRSFGWSDLGTPERLHRWFQIGAA